MIYRQRRSPFQPEQIAELLQGDENDRLLLLPGKSSVDAVAAGLAALANANGGLAVLGVTKRGNPQSGLEPAELRDRLVTAGLKTDPPLILPTPQTVELEKGPVVVLEVPAGLPHIYSLSGVYLTRTAGQNRPLTTPELRRLLFERTDAAFETGAVEQASLADLDNQQIQAYLEYIQASPQDNPLQILLARGCVVPRAGTQAKRPEEFQPTIAGLLLFGKQPQAKLRSAELICVRYSGPDMSDEFVRQDISGTLPAQIRQAEAFVSANMRRGMKIAGITREETTEYPIAVVREAIVNAVAHRDYSIRGEGIRLLMFSDRLTIYSPGRLPGHVTLENLQEERYSRNEAIVAVLSDLGYIERLGYGIDRMIGAMEEMGLPEPEFEETAAGFQVTLRSGGDGLVSSQPEQQPAQHGFLNERQERALAFLQTHERITNSDYQNLVPDVSAETIRRDLADLVEKNLLIRIGSKRATYYILK